MSDSLFPAPESRINWGPLGLPQDIGYPSEMIELTVRADRPDMLDECIARGWITPATRAFDNCTVLHYCDYKGAKQCAARLRRLGYPE